MKNTQKKAIRLLWLLLAAAVAFGIWKSGLITGSEIRTATSSEKQSETAATQTKASTASTSKESTAEKEEEALGERLTASWQPLLESAAGQADIAVYSSKYDTVYTLSNAPTEKFYTASIVKVTILAQLLHEREEQGTFLSDTEQAYAETMIENSDNDAATYLLEDGLGSYSATSRLFSDLKMTNSAADPESWGLTTTTAADQIKLLNAIFYPAAYLSATSQSYVKELMSKVETDQQWGISAGAETFQLKNGWLSLDDTGWNVNSIGHVSSAADSDGYTIAVLTNNDQSLEAGQELIEKLAQATREIMLP